MSDTYFNIVAKKIGDWLISKEYVLDSSSVEEDASKFVRYAKGEEAVQVQYTPEDKKFGILQSEDGGKNFHVLQVYLFDAEAGDGAAQADSVANEFIETLNTDSNPKYSPRSSYVSKKEVSMDDETSAVFFVNRFPTVLPEVRDPLLAHKEHYGQLLPNTFCEECVNIAIANLIKTRDKAKLQKTLDFLENMYKMGDSDVKSIITITILNNIENPTDIEMVEAMLGTELKKVWPAARKLKGKTFNPEKQTISQKFFSSLSNGQNTNGLR